MKDRRTVDEKRDLVRRIQRHRDSIVQALVPHSIKQVESMTDIPGPGNTVVVFWTEGDCHVALVSCDYEIMWLATAGGTRDGGNSVLVHPRSV